MSKHPRYEEKPCTLTTRYVLAYSSYINIKTKFLHVGLHAALLKDHVALKSAL